ncbi:hypothetical protein BOQ60_18005 [Chryseobacterium sp. CH1]|nr:hypothetical protein BOQ60_18005 [Chryseobacterium sp. CH1]
MQIGTATDWKSIASGSEHTFAIKANGTLWSWGSNSNGDLGDGTTVYKISPVQVGTDTNWKSVDGGRDHSIGLKTDGTLWAWGANNNGQLGDGTSENKFIPTQVGTETSWQSVHASFMGSSFAVKTDGTLWAWGDNLYGQLGDGTIASTSLPLLIGAADKQIAAAGMYNTAVISTNGLLSITGFNAMGQLGDGTIVQKKIFVPVACPTSSLAIVEVSAKADQLKVYPNPVQDILTVSFDQKILSVAVYNTAGQLVLTKAINDTKGTIDVSALLSGVYMVKINAANDFVKMVKVIKR